MNCILRSKKNHIGCSLLALGVATLVSSCKGGIVGDTSTSSKALTDGDLLVTNIGHRTDGVVSDRSMATSTGTVVGQTYTLTPAGHVTQETRADATTRYNRTDTLGRLQCVVTDSGTACPTTATAPLSSAVSTMAIYSGDKISNIRRRLAGGIANTRLEYDSAARNRPDRMVVSQGDCSTSSCETSFALAYDVWGSRATETPSSGQGAGSVSRRFTYGPDKRLRTVRVASPQAPDSSCNPTRWDQVDTDVGYGTRGVMEFRRRHIGTSILQSMRYLRSPDGEIAYILQAAGPTATDRVTYKYLTLSGERVLAVRETWSGSARTSRKYIFLHGDRMGAPLVGFVTDHPDAAASQQWVADRDSWGWTRISGDLPSDEIAFEFPGQVRLDGTEVTRLVNATGTCVAQVIQPAIISNGFRDYDPAVGVYLSRDPIALHGSNWATSSANRNLYGYAGFAPTERYDYWGLRTPGSSDEAATFLQFIPMVGPAIGLSNSIENGDWGMATANAAFLVIDLVTCGEGTLVGGGLLRSALNAEARNIGRIVVTEGLAAREAATAELSQATNTCDAAARSTTASPRQAPEIQLTQERFEHITERHWATSAAPNAGKFTEGTTELGLRSMIEETIGKGTSRPNTRGRPGRIFEYDFGSEIGVDMYGNATSRLRVAVEPGGKVKTAFPF